MERKMRDIELIDAKKSDNILGIDNDIPELDLDE